MAPFAAVAQTPLEFGPAAAAFTGGPLKLTKNGATVLREHYKGDRVPLIPQPFRGRLDTALVGRDWPRVEAAKKELTAARGIEATLVWEQTRFLATGGVAIAELHARDIAATGATGLAETAVMMWLYAAAVTLTDGRKCADASAKDAHLDRLRGPEFDAVTRVVKAMPEDRLNAMRDLAVRLEQVLSPERADDTMCREGTAKPEIKADAVWKPEAVATRAMLAKHLTALAGVMRPKPLASGGKPGSSKPVVPAKPAAAAAAIVPPPVVPAPGLVTVPDLTLFDPGEMQLLPVEPAPR